MHLHCDKCRALLLVVSRPYFLKLSIFLHVYLFPDFDDYNKARQNLLNKQKLGTALEEEIGRFNFFNRLQKVLGGSLLSEIDNFSIQTYQGLRECFNCRAVLKYEFSDKTICCNGNLNVSIGQTRFLLYEFFTMSVNIYNSFISEFNHILSLLTDDEIKSIFPDKVNELQSDDIRNALLRSVPNPNVEFAALDKFYRQQGYIFPIHYWPHSLKSVFIREGYEFVPTLEQIAAMQKEYINLAACTPLPTSPRQQSRAPAHTQRSLYQHTRTKSFASLPPAVQTDFDVNKCQYCFGPIDRMTGHMCQAIGKFIRSDGVPIDATCDYAIAMQRVKQRRDTSPVAEAVSSDFASIDATDMPAASSRSKHRRRRKGNEICSGCNEPFPQREIERHLLTCEHALARASAMDQLGKTLQPSMGTRSLSPTKEITGSCVRCISYLGDGWHAFHQNSRHFLTDPSQADQRRVVPAMHHSEFDWQELDRHIKSSNPDLSTEYTYTATQGKEYLRDSARDPWTQASGPFSHDINFIQCEVCSRIFYKL